LLNSIGMYTEMLTAHIKLENLSDREHHKTSFYEKLKVYVGKIKKLLYSWNTVGEPLISEYC